MRSGIVVATDGSLKKDGAMGAAFVAKDGRVQTRSVAVFGQPSSTRPELTGIALALEECPIEEDLTILTDSLSSMDLLQSMQRGDFPLSLYRHSVRHLLLHVVTLLNKRAAAGRITRFIKVRAHRGEPLNEAADALAAAAADLEPGRPGATCSNGS
jgi:ribonuclease HI